MQGVCFSGAKICSLKFGNILEITKPRTLISIYSWVLICLLHSSNQVVFQKQTSKQKILEYIRIIFGGIQIRPPTVRVYKSDRNLLILMQMSCKYLTSLSVWDRLELTWIAWIVKKKWIYVSLKGLFYPKKKIVIYLPRCGSVHLLTSKWNNNNKYPIMIMLNNKLLKYYPLYAVSTVWGGTFWF